MQRGKINLRKPPLSKPSIYDSEGLDQRITVMERIFDSKRVYKIPTRLVGVLTAQFAVRRKLIRVHLIVMFGWLAHLPIPIGAGAEIGDHDLVER